MKSKILEVLFKLKKYNTEEIGLNPKYQRELKNIIDNNKLPMHLEDILDLVKQPEMFHIFKESMDKIDEEALYKSDMHGISHNERVAVFTFAIGIAEKLEENDLKILLEAAKYHDIGRIDDSEDYSHGKRSAEKITEQVEALSEEDLTILKTICICHSIDDENFEDITKSMGVKDVEKCRKLVQVLKDADGLDRVRLNSNGLDSRYLRTESATRMAAGAYELLENYKDIQKDIAVDKMDEFPESIVDYGEEAFTEEQMKFLQEQWTKFNKYREYDINNNEIIKNNEGRLVLKQGTLIHGMSTYNEETLEKIADSGILSGDFIGIPEDAETFYCADFIRVKEDMRLEEIKESAGGRIPLYPTSNSIAFIVNPSEDIEEFTNTDAYSEKNDDNPIIRNLMNEKSGVVSEYLESEHRGELAAIPVGIPSNCFSGILVGDKLLNDESKIKKIIELFPNCYITTRTGQLIYEPQVEKLDKEEHSKLSLENARLSMENANFEKENDRLRRNGQKKDEDYKKLMGIIDEKCSPEILAEVYHELGWTQGMPRWLEEKLKEPKDLDEKDKKIVELEKIIESKEEQVNNLQKMLSRVLQFANEVRSSFIGKMFFKKSVKELQEGEGKGYER